MNALPDSSKLEIHSSDNNFVDRLFSKSFLLACVVAAVAVAATGLAQANDKNEKDLRINVQIGNPAPGYYYRAPVQQVIVRPAPVVVYEDSHYGHGRHNAHRGHGHYNRGHVVNNRGYSHVEYEQPAARYWVPAHQIWRGGVWMTVPGFYTASYVAPIPAPLYEPQPRYVSPGWLWVRGHWAWGGLEWTWAPGTYIRM
jgi:hypothetical protein